MKNNSQREADTIHSGSAKEKAVELYEWVKVEDRLPTERDAYVCKCMKKAGGITSEIICYVEYYPHLKAFDESTNGYNVTEWLSEHTTEGSSTAEEILRKHIVDSGVSDEDAFNAAIMAMEEYAAQIKGSSGIQEHLINRVEVIDGKGRSYIKWKDKSQIAVSLSVQDEGRTLKIFIKETPPI